MTEQENAELLKWKSACAELEEQVKLLVKTELKLRRTQAELLDSKKQVESSNRTLEERVKERTEALERKNAELADFTSSASHDLKEPLRKICVFSERLAQACADQLDDHGRDYLQRIMSATARMQRLIDDLLAYSRVATGPAVFAAVDLSRVFAEVATDLEVLIEKNRAQVTAEPLPVIEADPLQMRQLFQNLLGNALKFHAPDRAPVVHVYPPYPPGNGWCGITFQDNGIGIAPEYFDKIFGVFQRLHARDEFEGSGIGLAICRKIALRHGGSIRVESTPGEGSKFIVNLPTKQGAGLNRRTGG